MIKIFGCEYVLKFDVLQPCFPPRSQGIKSRNVPTPNLPTRFCGLTDDSLTGDKSAKT